MPSTSKNPTAKLIGRCIRLMVTAVLGVCFAVALAGADRATPGPRETVHTVLIETMRYTPTSIQVQVGDRIEFKNTDLVPHTVTSTGGRPFDSGPLEIGKAWALICDHEGEIAYGCTFHPTMKGSITVLPAR